MDARTLRTTAIGLGVVAAGLLGVVIGRAIAAPDARVAVEAPRAAPPRYSTPSPEAPAEEAPVRMGEWTAGERTISAETERVVSLHSVRTGHHADYDRLVFEFDGDALPAVRVITGDMNMHTMLCRVDIPLEGGLDETLLVSLGSTVDVYDGAAQPSLPAISEFWPACNGMGGAYPDALVYGVALTERRPYRLQVLRRPLRLVLDVQLAP